MPILDKNSGLSSPVCSGPLITRDCAVSAIPLRHESLFKSLPRESSNGQGAFRDPAFVDNKSLAVHRWVPWIAGYSAPFVDDVITGYLPQRKPALVLDPFCGVGTTLLQSVLRGYDAIGFEINPYASLAAHAKLSAPTIDLTPFDILLENLQTCSRFWKTMPVPVGTTPPPLKSRLPFFSLAVEKQVLHALSFLHS